MSTQYLCKNQLRRAKVLSKNILNGIDYLEVGADRKTLLVYFLHNLPGVAQEDSVPANSNALTADNILITGGIRVRSIVVESVTSFENLLTVRVSGNSDFSTYTLKLVDSDGITAPKGFDSQLSQVDFSFWVEDRSEFDCKTPDAPTEKQPPPPFIDYLAKDYASFRRLMLDRLAVTVPDWQERNPSDIGILLVEILAYGADHLSYYQDAVATEAYLGTARKRVSVRRHARMLDYFMHDGCNARAWVVLEVESKSQADGCILQAAVNSLKLQENKIKTRFLTKINLAKIQGEKDDIGVRIKPEKYEELLNQQPQVFEPLHDITLYAELNKINFYTWDNEQCRLPKGATKATLDFCDKPQLCKQLEGRVLIFEEVKNPQNGDCFDFDLTHRHAVRLTKVTETTDALNDDRKLLLVEWAVEDALPFDLWISNLDSKGAQIENISIVRGNVVLVDRGQTVEGDDADLGTVPQQGKYRPLLQFGPLTQQGYVRDNRDLWVTFNPEASATSAMNWEMRDVKPSISIWELGKRQIPWFSQQDLLNSDRFSREFVVETEDDGRTYLRFGDNQLGKRPTPGTSFQAIYRIGNGKLGNVGADTISHVVTDIDGITKVYNPLPAQGGTEPEAIEKARLDAPQAFRTQQRAVTASDYANVAQLYKGVKKAIANRRWTGSWYTIFITVDREQGLPVNEDETFKDNLRNFLESFRLAAHDLEIEGPRYIPLDIAMTVHLLPDYFRSSVKTALLETFSTSVLSNGKLGFFHPDNFTFGQPVYLSQVVTTAMQIPGVSSVELTKFQRWQQPSNRELENGQIPFDRLEIARVDNNPNAPENGQIVFNMKGGR
ncbi:putative phage Mu protein gp47-like protein [Rivularia sp. PCC 7116]|uniref:putative baseplate assembly protein n=1 Tax=Rivularia sp. PCC 7116 TaxID=373994 RepID=UPI00029F4E53|nr:putative baseplate assembly protein [Rivularia sp. PCC 7116]AFY57591.1 putative phage Mu protein gp47-like protein [Rivularia sp. PCC 7116]